MDLREYVKPQFINEIIGELFEFTIPNQKIKTGRSLSGTKAKPIVYYINNKGCFVCVSHKRNIKGYIQAARWQIKARTLHRIIYKCVHQDDLPSDIFVMHSCDNPSCINPAHLSSGTNIENQADCIAKQRQCRGENKASNKLSTEQVLEILSSPLGSRCLSKQYGVCRKTIWNIVKGNKWKHLLQEGPGD